VGNWNEDLQQCQGRKCGQTCERVDGRKERKGKRIKSQAMDRKKLAQEATGPIDSSFMNLDKFAR